MKEISLQLLALVDNVEAGLRAMGEAGSSDPILAGGWSRKQVIGHLIDSAANNHQRFVRCCLQESVTLPGYEQDGWSRAQHVEDAEWSLLVGLWASYNRYLGHIIARLPAEKLEVPCRIGVHPPVTLRFVVEDYLVHMRHHLAQIGLSD